MGLRDQGTCRMCNLPKLATYRDQMSIHAPRGKPVEELVSICVLRDDLGALDAPSHDVVGGADRRFQTKCGRASSLGYFGMPG